jgi:hypothetical protein
LKWSYSENAKALFDALFAIANERFLRMVREVTLGCTFVVEAGSVGLARLHAPGSGLNISACLTSADSQNIIHSPSLHLFNPSAHQVWKHRYLLCSIWVWCVTIQRYRLSSHLQFGKRESTSFTRNDSSLRPGSTSTSRYHCDLSICGKTSRRQ